MIKKLICFAFLSLAAACTQTAAPEFANFEGERIRIDAEVEAGLITGNLVLRINDEVVIEQQSEAFGGSSQTFKGTWQGKDVRARVTLVQNLFSTYRRIDVFIDGVMVDTLTV